MSLCCGQMPWSIASKNKEKPTVAAMKEEYLEDPMKLINWLAEQTKIIEETNVNVCRFICFLF